MNQKIIPPFLWIALGATCAVIVVESIAPRPVIREPRPALLSAPPDDQILDTQVGHVVLDKVPLSKAITSLADQMNLSVVVKWDQVENAAAVPVTVDLRNVTIGRAFEAILETQRIAQFKFAVHNGVLCIGSEMEGWPREAETRAYDVRDLIDDYIAYDLHPSEPGQGNRRHPPTTQDCREAVNRITKWLDVRLSDRGYIDDVTEFAGRLLVTGPPELHDRLRHYFDELRQTPHRPGAFDGAVKTR